MNMRSATWMTLAVVPFLILAAQRYPTNPILISNVTVIDGTGRTPSRGMSVVIAGDRIAAIGAVLKVKAPPNAVVMDGSGKYLIPGLWNMHAHLGSYADGSRELSDYLAEGVTGIRDMGSPLDDILRLRGETNDGTIMGPHLVVAGPIVQGPLPFRMPAFISVNDAAAGRDTVRMLQNRGVDFIKVQDAIPHDIYLAVAMQARYDHISFAGHIPPTVLPEEASDLGQRSIEHLGGRFWGVLIGASTLEPELHASEVKMYEETIQALKQGGLPTDLNMRAGFTRKVVESYNSQKAAALFSRFRTNNTWQCPTLVVLRTLWTGGGAQYTPEDLYWSGRLLAKDAEVVAMMQRAGVGLLAGTDLPPNAANGTIHDELSYLVESGLTPVQALATATRNPAIFLGAFPDLGTIEVGKFADLVLLDASPLDDIHNTRRISSVIARGRVVYRQSRT